MKIEDKICALIPSIDYQKVPLLTAISNEEGANFIEIRIRLEDDLAVLKDLNTSKYKLIYSIEPEQFIPENKESIVEKMKQMIKYEPYAIEINAFLSLEKISEIIMIAKENGIKTHLAKYFSVPTKNAEIKNYIKELAKLNVEIIKIVTPIQNDFEAIELFSFYNKFSKKELILIPKGDNNKFTQILTVFLGGKYTYGYISRKSDEALLPINILKKNLEMINDTTDDKLFQK